MSTFSKPILNVFKSKSEGLELTKAQKLELAWAAYLKDPTRGARKLSKEFGCGYRSIRDRMIGVISKADKGIRRQRLTPKEEDCLAKHVL